MTHKLDLSSTTIQSTSNCKPVCSKVKAKYYCYFTSTLCQGNVCDQNKYNSLVLFQSPSFYEGFGTTPYYCTVFSALLKVAHPVSMKKGSHTFFIIKTIMIKLGKSKKHYKIIASLITYQISF